MVRSMSDTILYQTEFYGSYIPINLHLNPIFIPFLLMSNSMSNPALRFIKLYVCYSPINICSSPVILLILNRILIYWMVLIMHFSFLKTIKHRSLASPLFFFFLTRKESQVHGMGNPSAGAWSWSLSCTLPDPVGEINFLAFRVCNPCIFLNLPRPHHCPTHASLFCRILSSSSWYNLTTRLP